MNFLQKVTVTTIVIFFFLIFLFSMQAKADPDFEIRCVLGQVILIHKISGNLIQLSKGRVFMQCTPKLIAYLELQNGE